MSFDPLLVALALLGVVVVGVAVASFRRSSRPLPPPPEERLPPAEPPSESPSAPASTRALDDAAPEPEPEPEPQPAIALEPAAQPEPPAAETPRSYEEGLAPTRKGLLGKLNAILFSGSALDEDLLEELEAVLVTSDIGIRTTQKLIDEVRTELGRKATPEAARDALRRRIRELLADPAPPLKFDAKPMVIMVIGVNGAGKTTTIGKLSSRFAAEGKKVVLAAGDTFRAAACEQLEIWGERTGATTVRGADKADPSSVMYDAIQAARREGADVCLCDTAGRLHTKVNLMEELKKVRRSMGKAMDGAPHEVMLVVDATTGQNAIAQAKQFKEAVELDSIALTKLDGTAKGGVVVAIADELGVPVRYVGIGEQVADLRDFDPDAFVDALFDEG